MHIIHTEPFKSEAIPAQELPSHVTSFWTTSIRIPGAIGNSVSPHLGQSGCTNSDTVCSEARQMQKTFFFKKKKCIGTNMENYVEKQKY